MGYSNNWNTLYGIMAIVLILSGVATAIISGISGLVIMGILLGIGFATVSVRPSTYHHFMIGSGTIALVYAVLLILGNGNLALAIIFLVVGIACFARGIQYKYRAPHLNMG